MAVLGQLADWIRAYSEAQPVVTLAVSGGRSPIALFEALSDMELAWERVRIALVDERLVGQGHPASNTGLVQRHLLRGRASTARLLAFMPEGDEVFPDPGPWVNQANELLEDGAIDIVVLGMGTDGHTASLFPGEPDLQHAIAPDAPTYVAMSLQHPPPEAPYHRITLSLRAILSARQRLLTVAGPQKRAVLAQARLGVSEALPISLVLGAGEHPTTIFEEE